MTKLMKMYQILPLKLLSDAIVVKIPRLVQPCQNQNSRQDIGVQLYKTTKTVLIKKDIIKSPNEQVLEKKQKTKNKIQPRIQGKTARN
jgi:hypothetical protein